MNSKPRQLLLFFSVCDELVFVQGPAAGDPAAEPLQLAPPLLRLQPPPVLALPAGGGAGHPALHPAPAEDPPEGAAAGRGAGPPLG